ncbi:MAG: 6-hydroxymethylpterin diphosphokinase MptE-like protein [Phycisphaerales bacterium]
MTVHPHILENNLRALAARSPRAAEAVARATPRRDTTFSRAQDGAPTGVTGLGSSLRRLASEYQPLREAQRLADSVDLIAAAAVVVRGFGIGHHITALARRLGAHGTVVVFEPDVELLRSVLERVDFVPTLASCPVVIVTSPQDKAELTGVLTGLEGVVALGTRIIDHPASRPRLRDTAETFARTLAEVVAAIRTNVATTLVQVEVTLRNVLNNAGVYTQMPGISDLAGVSAGVPAILVSAGPSLRKNIELLTQPGIRDRVVIIAVQTALKQLLALGIRPHYVTALDYHEISARFYEGLSPQDVQDTTLVIEPKCNPAIPAAFPGKVRCVGDDTMDRVLGDALARPMGSLPPGATVAHLSYALARHLGCDPVILVGQDLGFTNHQYYGSGAAIHQVWSSELSAFRTLEMLEWERVARMRGLLRRVSDQQGRAIYTDEQMATYQVLFERAFQKDAAAGLTTIDATEGGTLKQHTRALPLALALERAARHTSPPAHAPATAPLPTDPARIDARLRDVAQSARELQEGCKSTILDLSEMLEHLSDQPRVNALIERVTARGQSLKQQSAYWIAQHMNQAGALNRFRADRAIALSPSLTPDETQRRQIERDIRNVRFLGEAAQQASSMLEHARAVLHGAAPHTRDPAAHTADTITLDTPAEERKRVVAVIHFDERCSALGGRRSSSHGAACLQRTLARLLMCKELDAIVVAAASRSLAEAAIRGAGVQSPNVLAGAVDIHRLRARRASVAAARIWSRHSWRGGIAGLTVFDEALCPAVDAPLAAEVGADAIVPVSDDWVVVDPLMVDAVVARYREAPDRHRFTFSQAPPGLCPCVIGAGLVRDMAANRGSAFGGVRSSVAGLLAYLPDAPRHDPIAKAPCVAVPHTVRDSLWRCTGDDVNFMESLERTCPDCGRLDMRRCVDALRDADASGFVPEHLELIAPGGTEEANPEIGAAIMQVRALAQRQPLLGVTVLDAEGSGEWRALADGARAAGAAAVHLRTSHRALMRFGVETLVDAMDFGLGVISVELPGDSRFVWEARSGEDTRDRVWEMLQEFIDERNRRSVGGMPSTWLVPRLTRCDATLDDVEMFYDRWLTACGACVIDAPAGSGDAWRTVEALPEPAHVRARRGWSVRRVEVGDGSVGASRGAMAGAVP